MTMTSVLVVDDQMLVRAGFVALLSAQSDLEVIGEAGDGHGAVELVNRHRPDVVLMDIRMPNMDGIEATKLIVAATAGETSVLILTTFDADEYVYAALRAGASGFLLKDTPPEELVKAVRIVAEGNGLLAPQVTGRLIRTFANNPSAMMSPRPPLPALTEPISGRLSTVNRATKLPPASSGRCAVALGGSWLPLTREKLTPACSNTAPSRSTRVRPPPPAARCQASSSKCAEPSSCAIALQMRSCSPRR